MNFMKPEMELVEDLLNDILTLSEGEGGDIGEGEGEDYE